MGFVLDSFQNWITYCEQHQLAPWEAVMEYERFQKGHEEQQVWQHLEKAYMVMKEAIETGLTQPMRSRSGMIHDGAKRVKACKINVLDESFKKLIYRTLAAKEVNSCMGRIVAAPTAGASGILPGILVHLQEVHNLDDRRIYEGMLVASGIGIIIARRASVAGAVGGCQAETGSAAAMGAGAITYCLGGSMQQIANAAGIAIMDLLGLVCDPVAGLVEIPCVPRNASAAVVAFAAAQMALADFDAVIPPDEVIDAMAEIGNSMPARYKETALGGLAATPTGKKIAQKVLKHKSQIRYEEENPS